MAVGARRMGVCAIALAVVSGLAGCGADGGGGGSAAPAATGASSGPSPAPSSARPAAGLTGTDLVALLPVIDGFDRHSDPASSGDALKPPSEGVAHLPATAQDCGGSGWDRFWKMGETSPAALGVLDQLGGSENPQLAATGMTAYGWGRLSQTAADHVQVFGSGIYQFADPAVATAEFTALQTYIVTCAKYPTGFQYETVTLDRTPVAGHPAIAGHITLKGHDAGLEPIDAYFLLVSDGAFLVGATASAVATVDGVAKVTAPASPTLASLVTDMAGHLG